ncbi:phosphatase 2C-like domain-containing protein [Morchella snyderi]|nr:phosphatase 2C-like domain-containing protein [Morchella snyderi]
MRRSFHVTSRGCWRLQDSYCGSLRLLLVDNERVRGKRSFHDYFTSHLPGSSVFPDSVPPNKQISPETRATTVVRIPLRSAKHHFGVTRSRGNRPYNEDWYQAGVIDIPTFAAPSPIKPKVPPPPGDPSVFYFGVFDGHGGEDCSRFLKENLHTYIEEGAKNFGLGKEGEPDECEKIRHDTQEELVAQWRDTVGGYFRRFKPDFGPIADVEGVLMYAFLRADMDFITKVGTGDDGKSAPETVDNGNKTKVNPFKGGSTASIALISTATATPFWNPSTSATLITAHLGDTRIVLCSTETGLAVPVTTNHHPSSPAETRRLRRYATAFVSDSFGEERFGVLANTRSFGDVSQKRLGVSAEPEITRREIRPAEFSFMVLVSDGVSATLTDQEICDIVKECKTPDEASKELVEFAEEVTTEGDNATAVVVRLGGWEKRGVGGEGYMGTKDLRAWRRDEALVGSRGRRM